MADGMKPKLIISGGQTGADQGGLYAAQALGINTGGWAPKGYRTETGPNLALRDEFRLMEHETDHDYAPRTRANVEMGDATVIFGKRSRGSNLTERLCKELGKPMLWLDHPPAILLRSVIPRSKFRLWLIRTQPEVLNVAGNRESVSPGIQEGVTAFLIRTLGEL